MSDLRSTATSRSIADKLMEYARSSPDVLAIRGLQAALIDAAIALTNGTRSEIRQTNSERAAGIAQATEPLAGGTALHAPAPEREGEIAARESLEPEGPATVGLIVEPAAEGRAERLDTPERRGTLSAGEANPDLTEQEIAELQPAVLKLLKEAGRKYPCHDESEFLNQVDCLFNMARRSMRSSAAENERVSYRIGYVDGATGKPPQVKLTEGEQASIGTKSAMRAICPENMQPCKEGCVDGWCQTMFGHPNG